MSEEAGFIAALAAAPDDETAALAFSDWLQERGDPRAPMLRDAKLRALIHPKYENPLPRLRAAIETGKKVTEAGRTFALIGEPAVPELVSLLGHQTPLVRLRAMKALSQMGEKARSAIPALLEFVKGSNQEDYSARREAVRLLGVMREKEAARDEFAKGLDSTDPAERLAAVRAIAKLNSRTKAIGHSLCKALADESDAVRHAAAEQLRYIASPSMAFAVEPLCRALSDANPFSREFVLIALGKIGPKAAAAVPALLDFLKREPAPTEGERKAALESLLALGVRTPEVLGALLAALRDPATMQLVSRTIQEWGELPPSAVPGLLAVIRRPLSERWYPEWQAAWVAIHALARVRPRPPELMTELRAQLATENAPHAAQVLAELGPEAAAFLPDLIAAFSRSDYRSDQALAQIARTLGKIGGDGITVLAAALDRVPTKENPRPAAAADGLATAGAAARPALPVLLAQLRRLREGNERVSLNAVINALTGIGADAAGCVPDLVALALAVYERNNNFASFYVRSLRAFGPAVLPFVPQLAAAIRPPANPWLHEAIVELVGELVPHGCDAVPILRAALHQTLANYVATGYVGSNYEWQRVASAVVEEVAKLGPAAGAVIEDLIRAGQVFGDYLLRQEILAALGKIGGAAVPHLRAALTDPYPIIRRRAVEALVETGDTSAETRAALRALEADEDEDVRAQVAALLQKNVAETLQNDLCG